MNALSPAKFEELIGRQMAHLAYSEGHRRGFPKVDFKSIEKAKVTRSINHRNTAIGHLYRHKVLKAVKVGIETSNKIAMATDIPEDSVRKALRQLEADGMIQRAGHVNVPGGKRQVWKSNALTSG